MRAVVVVVLVAAVAGAQPVPWSGTIGGRAVSCTSVPTFPDGPDEPRVAFLGLWCRGTRRHAVHVGTWSVDRVGTLRVDGLLCTRGPRPRAWRTAGKGDLGGRLQPRGQCCRLQGTVAGTFTPTVPPEAFDSSTLAFLPMTGELTAVRLTARCRHRRKPVTLSAE
jgi:hypothetical protein